MSESSSGMSRITTWDELFVEIRKRPGMYLSRTSIYGLNLLISSFRWAEDFHHVPEKDRMGGFDFEGFERWVALRHNPRQLTLNSYALAERVAGSESAGFDLWFEWYDTFVESQGHFPET